MERFKLELAYPALMASQHSRRIYMYTQEKACNDNTYNDYRTDDNNELLLRDVMKRTPCKNNQIAKYVGTMTT